MRAAGRLALQYFVLFPTQRRLLEAAGVLLALAGVFELAGERGGPLAALAAVLLLIPLFATIGFVFCALAAPRTHRLLPAFRPQLLAVTMLVVAAGAGVAGLLVNAVEHLGPVPYVYAAGGLSTMLWLMAIGPRSAAGWCVPWLLGLAAIGAVDKVVPAVDHESVAYGVAAVLVVAWLVFAYAYLQGRPIRPLKLATRGGDEHDKPAAIEADLPLGKREAAAAYLSGGLGRPAQLWLKTALALVPILLLVALIGTLTGEAGARASLGLPLLLALLVPIRAYGSALRARLLWLRSGACRSELFGMIERDLLGTQLATAVLIGIVPPGIAAAFVSVPGSAFAAIPLCAAAIAVAGSYLALSVRSLGALEVLVSAIYLLGVGVAGVAALLEPMRIDVLLQVAAVYAAAAVALRLVAIARWRNVDWLVLRMPRAHRAL